MFYLLQHILRAARTNGFTVAFGRAVFVLFLSLVLPVAACAYTLVMRGGHRIEIPDKFQLTRTALTYEAAPGLSVTLQVANIDIAETERANNEPQGSFLKRADARDMQSLVPAKASSAPRARTRTLTNLDLEGTRRARLESEAAYERRRVELGLPSREETERRRAEDAARARELFSRSDAEKSQAESYWRALSASLREEINVIDAEANYLRARIAEMPDTVGAVTFANTGLLSPFIFSTPNAPAPLAVNQSASGIRQTSGAVASVGFGGGQTRGQISLGYANSYGSFRQRGFIRGCRFAPCFPAFAGTYPYNSYSYDRSQLLLRLRELETTRAGLQARWRQLEDEARRAGAQPGWLRP